MISVQHAMMMMSGGGSALPANALVWYSHSLDDYTQALTEQVNKTGFTYVDRDSDHSVIEADGSITTFGPDEVAVQQGAGTVIRRTDENKFHYSSTFNQTTTSAKWLNDGVLVTDADYVVNDMSFAKVQDDSAAGAHRIRTSPQWFKPQGGADPARGLMYAIIERGTTDYLCVSTRYTSTNWAGFILDISTGLVTDSAPVNNKITLEASGSESLGDDVYLVWAIFANLTPGSDSLTGMARSPVATPVWDNVWPSYAGDGTSYFGLHHMQWSPISALSGPIITNNAVATRLEDKVWVDTPAVPVNNFVYSVEATLLGSDASGFPRLTSSTTVTDTIEWYYDAATKYVHFLLINSVGTVDITIPTIVNAGDSIKLAATKTAGGLSVDINDSGAPITDASLAAQADVSWAAKTYEGSTELGAVLADWLIDDILVTEII